MQALLSKRSVAELIGVHEESLMRLVRQGRFCRPIRLHPGTRGRVRFDMRDVDQWLEARKAEVTK